MRKCSVACGILKHGKEELSAARVKAAKSVLSEENFAFLKELDGDPCSLINLAVEQFLNQLREKGHAEIYDPGTTVRRGLRKGRLNKYGVPGIRWNSRSSEFLGYRPAVAEAGAWLWSGRG